MNRALCLTHTLLPLTLNKWRSNTDVLLHNGRLYPETNRSRYIQQEIKADKYNRLQTDVREYKHVYTVRSAKCFACFTAGIKEVTKGWLRIFMS